MVDEGVCSALSVGAGLEDGNRNAEGRRRSRIQAINDLAYFM